MIRSCLSALILAVIPADAFAHDSLGIDPLAIEIATTSSEYLAVQPSMSVGWLVTYDDVLDGREKRTSVWTGESLLVRGEGYRASSFEGSEIRDYIYDGATFTVVFADQAEFTQLEMSGGFAELVEALDTTYGFTLPLSDVFDQSGAAEGLAGASEAVYLGEVLFGGEPAHHLAFRRYEGDWELFISTDPAKPVPLMMTGTNPYLQGWPKFQAVFYGWNFSPEVSEESFNFSEPSGYARIDLPKIEEANP